MINREPTTTSTVRPFETSTNLSLPILETTPVGETCQALENRQCGFRIDMPFDWVAVDYTSNTWYQHPKVDKCIFGLRPGNWQEMQQQSDILLEEVPVIIVIASAPPQAVSALVFLWYKEGTWFVEGRHSLRAETEVRYLHGNLLVRRQGTYGLMTKDTYSYAGLGGVWRALLWDGGERTALFEDYYYDEGLFDKSFIILDTI
jgi:hypothetical protein